MLNNLNIRSLPGAPVRLLSTFLSGVVLCAVLTACGGGGDNSAAGVTAAADRSASAAAATPQGSPSHQIAASERRAVRLSATSTGVSAEEGVRLDVASFIAALVVTDAQRTVLYQAARALQAALTVDLARGTALQIAVNDLAQARACLRAHFTDGESVGDALQARTYDTLLRRLRYAAFLIASRLLAQWPADATCAITPPPPPPPPPSTGQQLREEIVRLEQQGVLPTLDRGTDIRGLDANANGVRDDVEAYLAALTATDSQKKAAMQTARNQQAKLLVDPMNKEAVASMSRHSIAASKCMADVFEDAVPNRSGALSLKIEAITANTPERAKRYIHYMAALSGTSVDYPSGNTCEE